MESPRVSRFAQAVAELAGRIDAGALRILLTAPEGADGDSIGSQLALTRVLQARWPGRAVRIVNGDPVPGRYAGLPGAEAVLTPAAADPTPDDLALVLDGGRERAGAATALFDSARVHGILDHHRTVADHPYDLELRDPDASSTAELVDRIRRHPTVNVPLDREMAACLYAGLVFDTGYFRHSSTTPEILRLAAALMETGFDFTEVGESVLLRRSPQGLRLLSLVLARVSLAGGGRIAWSTLRQADLVATGAEETDREGIIDHLALVWGVRLAALCSETRDGRVRCSLRARGAGLDVAALASRLSPGGGGHAAAAGCTLEGPLAVATGRVIEELERLLQAPSPREQP